MRELDESVVVDDKLSHKRYAVDGKTIYIKRKQLSTLFDNGVEFSFVSLEVTCTNNATTKFVKRIVRGFIPLATDTLVKV